MPLGQIWIYQRWNPPGGRKHRVIIVGGGFAGLYAAMDLDKSLGHHKDLEILLIDRNNYFLFPPLLPSAATGTVESRQVTFPFRRILETTNIVFHMANVEKIDPARQVVHTTATADSSAARAKKDFIETRSSIGAAPRRQRRAPSHRRTPGTPRRRP